MALTSEVRAQAGSQSDFTTEVAPSIALRGLDELSIRSTNEVEIIGDMTAGLAGGNTAIINSIAGAGSLSGWPSYEHIVYFLDNLMGLATPTGIAPSHIRAYAAPLETAPSPRILGFVKGTSGAGAYKLVGALLTSFTLRFEPGVRASISGDLIGSKLVPSALGVLSIPTVTPIMAQHLSSIKWDTWAGTMGATAMPLCTVRFAELTVTPDRTSRMCFGALSAGSYTEKPWMGMLKLGLEFNGTTKTYVDSIVNGDISQKQVELTATLGTQSLKVQFAGTVTDEIEVFGDDDGVVTVDINLERQYHPTFANWLKITSTNTLATLT